MRFRPSQTPPHLDRRLQRRMLGYVAVIAVVMVAFQLLPQARKPQQPGPVAGQPAASPDEMDFQVRDVPDRPLAPDEFRSVPEPAAEGTAAETVRPELPTAAPAAAGEADPQLDRTRLAAVRDNTLGIRADESEAFFYVLDHVRRVPGTFLEQSAQPGVQYVNLMTDPTLYRGEPVTITGEMWRLYEFPANENRYGLTTLYEAWIFTSDSSTHPFRVVATSLGDGIQPGDNQRTPVRLTGYFFKREGYETPGGLHVAPTLLARRISRYRAPGTPPPADGLAPIMLGVVVAIGLILSATLLSFAWSDRRTPRRSSPLPPLSGEAAAQMEASDARSIAEQLRALADREREEEYRRQHGGGAASLPERNGKPVAGDEIVDLPTPFPPTRVPPSERGGSGPTR